jgi:hypothetical protein
MKPRLQSYMTEKVVIPERKKRDNKIIKVFKPETPEPSPERI